MKGFTIGFERLLIRVTTLRRWRFERLPQEVGFGGEGPLYRVYACGPIITILWERGRAAYPIYDADRDRWIGVLPHGPLAGVDGDFNE